MLPATFEMAFAGHRAELVDKLDVSSGLLERLLDRGIITKYHFDVVKVSALILYDFHCVRTIFYYAACGSVFCLCVV